MLIKAFYKNTAFSNNQCKQISLLITTEFDVDRFGEHVQSIDNDLNRPFSIIIEILIGTENGVIKA